MDKNEPKSPSGMDEAVATVSQFALQSFAEGGEACLCDAKLAIYAPLMVPLYLTDPAPLRAKIAEQEAEIERLSAEVVMLREAEKVQQ